jgi:hypothetical protein
MAESGLGEIHDRLVRLGTVYLAFTAAHTLRWRALFERCSVMSRSY